MSDIKDRAMILLIQAIRDYELDTGCDWEHLEEARKLIEEWKKEKENG